MNPERNVGLEVIHHEGVCAGGLPREGVGFAEGGGALEGDVRRWLRYRLRGFRRDGAACGLLPVSLL